MDEQRVEAAVRAGPPDEPTYRGDVSDRLRTRMTAAGEHTSPEHVVELVDVTARRRRPVLAVSVAVAATVMLVVALAVVARPHQLQPATTPPTVISSPSSSIASGSRLAELAGRWVGATPGVVATPDPSAPAFVVFGADRVSLEHLAGGIVNDFTSQVSVTGVGQLRLVLTDQAGRCAAGAVGNYRVTLSPQATVVTLVAVTDECSSRGEALTGTWTRTACPVRGSDCLGQLESGRHASVHFDPFGSGSYGEVSYEVTDGWSSTFDDPSRLTLLPPTADGSATHGLYLFADVAPVDSDCSATTGTATANTAAGTTAIAAVVSATPGLSVTTSEATVGTYRADVLDLTAATTLPCAGEQPLLESKPGGLASWTLAIGPGQRMRIVLIDLRGGRTMAVVVASDRSADEYAQLLDASTAVIDSFVLSAAR